MFTVDHVIVVVEDLDDAAKRLLEEYGLASIPGGRHPGHGTGNRIVPLGDDYLELMTVADPVEADESPLGRWALRHAGAGLEIAAVCLRTDDIDRAASILDDRPLAMSRRTPDGDIISWRLAGLDGMIEHGWPFFIEWDTARHPGRGHAEHTVEPVGITAVRLPAPTDAIAEMLGDVPGLTFGADRPAARIETERGAIEL